MAKINCDEKGLSWREKNKLPKDENNFILEKLWGLLSH